MSGARIRLGQDVCGRRHQAMRLEWLETNGLGGFASSTVSGIHTRRYHGLLTAALSPPVGRYLLLSKFEEALVVDGQRYEFSSNEYPGVIHPDASKFLCEFRLDPFPIFTYQIAGLELEKRVFMVHGQNTTVVEYELRSIDRDPPPLCVLELRPLLAFRDYHSTSHRNEFFDGRLLNYDGGVTLRPYADLPALHLSHSPATCAATEDWYYNFEFAQERERGLDYTEDLYNPCSFTFDLNANPHVALIASTQKVEAGLAGKLRDEECQRRRTIDSQFAGDEPCVQLLAQAADQFIVQRGSGQTIIAGYHWFSDWGRDTMIALPGLTLATGRFGVARHVLSTFAAAADSGMLPNRFPDYGEAPEFNTVDASLWFFEAVRAYLAYTNDYRFVRESVYAALKQIFYWHRQGTRYGIVCEDDGLLRCGEDGVQLTWMDAKIGDWVVTPRQGKPVEIQALWFNAVCVLEDLAGLFGERELEAECAALQARCKQSFQEQFWNPAAQCLFDVVDGEQRDGSIRPNQVFAVSLHHSMLEDSQAKAVVDRIGRDLLTPLGLRTLCPRDPRYRGIYSGGVLERDSAYHQGTVWPWLLGPFITAYLKVHGRTKKARDVARQMLGGLEAHLLDSGLGQISEIADGNYPHMARGCMAQAWSVAELLRVFVEEFQSQGARANLVREVSSAA